jgi:hypothetical protein
MDSKPVDDPRESFSAASVTSASIVRMYRRNDATLHAKPCSSESRRQIVAAVT